MGIADKIIVDSMEEVGGDLGTYAREYPQLMSDWLVVVLTRW